MGWKGARGIMPTLRRGEGFSLLEIIVVLVLMGVAAAVIMPSFTRGLKGLELETSGRDLITHLKQARSEAIGKQKVFRVIVNEQSYVLANEFGETIRQFNLPEGISLEAEVELPLVISFYASGRSNGGVLALVNETGKRMWIRVDPITGFGRAR